MRLKLWTYTVVAASLFQPWAFSAQAATSFQLDQGVELIVKNLEALTPSDPNVTPIDVPTMMKQIVVGFRTQLGECVNPLTTTIAECLRGQQDNGFLGGVSTKYLNAGLKSGKIDAVERALLIRYFSAVTDVTGNTADGVTVAETPLMAEPKGKGIAEPSLPVYRQNKIDYTALRVAKKMDAVLPADLAAQMEKAFPRKMNGVGLITAEEFFAALPNFGRLQLNELAGLMVSATDLMTRPDSKVVSYPADYAFTSRAIKSLQDKEAETVKDIGTAPDAPTLQQYQTLLATLRAQENALEQKDPIDALGAQRASLAATLSTDEDKITTCAPVAVDCATAIADVQAKRDAIDSIDSQLGDLIRTNELAPTDVQRFAVNVLKQNLYTLNQNAPFAGLNLALGDVLMSAWVSGDISSDSLLALSQMSDLKETHTSIWKKILTTTWNIAQPVLMAVPSTSYIAIGVGIFLQIRQESANANLVKENATHLIPDQN
jgi:hypothetical protein